MNNWTEALEFYLKTPYEVIQFPVAPQEFTVNFPSLNKTINVLNFGEVPILGANALRTWTISSFFPAQEYSFCQCKPKEPMWYCKLIDSMKYHKTPCRFIVTTTRLNSACSIEEFNWGVKDGTRDIYFTLSFKEHKVVGQKRMVII
ncbi:terminase [Clostridium botulinum]